MSLEFNPANFNGTWPEGKIITELLNYITRLIITKNKELDSITLEYFNGTTDVVAMLPPLSECNDTVKLIEKMLDKQDPTRRHEAIITHKLDTDLAHFLWLLINALAVENPVNGDISNYICSIEGVFNGRYDAMFKELNETKDVVKKINEGISKCNRDISVGSKLYAEITNENSGTPSNMLITLRKLFFYISVCIYTIVLGNPPVVVKKAAAKSKTGAEPAVPAESGYKTTTVQIDFDYIHTILLTLMTVNSTPENLDRYTIISMAISNANAQQDEYKKLHTTPKTKKPAAKSVNPAVTAEALAEAKGN